MARDDESAPEVVTTEVTAPETESTENQTEVQAEAPSAEVIENLAEGEQAEQAEKPAEPTGPSAEEIKASVEAFATLATEVVDTRDKSTGDLSVDEITKVKIAYAALPTPQAKTKARNGLEAGMRDALSKELDVTKARAYMILGTEIKSAGARDTVAKPPVDPTEDLVNRVTAMYLSSSLVSVPEGVATDWVTKVQELGASLSDSVQAYKAYLDELDTWADQPEDKRGDEPKAPEVSDVVLNAAKIARGRGLGTRTRKTSSGTAAPKASGPGYSGPRRNVKAHIASAFANEPVGKFLKISEIAGHTSDEYGDDHPSSGAVTASLESAKFDVAGVQLDTENGVKGARKIA